MQHAMSRFIAALILILATVSMAQAEPPTVQVRFGELLIKENDIALNPEIREDDIPLKSTRGYNSSNTAKGIFGVGWSSPLEGRIVIKDGNPFNLYEICSAMPVPYYAAEWSDSEAKVTPTYASDRCGCHLLLATPDGFDHVSGDVIREHYDPAGHLRAINNGYTPYVVVRDGKGRVAGLSMDGGKTRTLRLDYNKQGFVRRMEGLGARLSYDYDTEGHLVSVHYGGMGWRNSLIYDYDGQGRLVAVKHGHEGDASKFTISYYPSPLGNKVASIQDYTGEITRYAYKEKGGHTAPQEETIVVTADDENSRRTTTRYRHFLEKHGSRSWVRKLIVTGGEEGGMEKKVFISPGKLSVIARSSGETRFVYDSLGRLAGKEGANGQVAELSYFRGTDKISRIRRYAKESPEASKEAWFGYDAQLNLIEAANSEGERLTMTYDRNKRISALRWPGKSILMSYNQSGKPLSIAVQGVGVLNMAYDQAGVLSKTDGDQKTALEVKSQMERLRRLIGSAIVTYDF